MSSCEKEATSGRHRPYFVMALAVLLILAAVASIVAAIVLVSMSDRQGLARFCPLLGGILLAGFFATLVWGVWSAKSWARSLILLVLVVGGFAYGMDQVFSLASRILAGEHMVALGEILKSSGVTLLQIAGYGAVPLILFLGMRRTESYFVESPRQRALVDKAVRNILIGTALSSIVIVFLIIVFTMSEAWDSITQIGLENMLLGTIWRPGSIIGTEDAQFGLVPMIVGSILSTFGAVVLGVPLSVLTAILLAEVAPSAVRETIRPAIELLAGIPSVVYGLFGMVVLAPLIRTIDVPYNTGFGILNASIILAVMIIPTVTNITEDAIRAVPRSFREGSLALGATRWQTIVNVILPAARSGIVAAVILGIGRALGETMAMIMVIGNSIAIPTPLNKNPLTLFLSSARTLTGNVAVEINYAAGAHRSALFFTGILLFVMILLVNTVARYLMRERLASKKEA